MQIQQKKYITTGECADLLCITKSTLYRYKKLFKDFPQPICLSERKKFYLYEEVIAWVNKQNLKNRT